MPEKKDVQLSQLVDTRDTEKVIEEVLRIFYYHYSEDSALRVRLAFSQVRSLFAGEFPGYRECLAEYHDFSHTMNVLLTTARLLDGYNIQRVFLPEELAIHLLLAALLHDTGYIQEDWDTEGTGAKYTPQHEQRSIEFLKRHFEVFEIEEPETESIIRLIQSTDLKTDFARILFPSEEEQDAGAILGSADILGQMSDRAYLEKLLFLYHEFREAGIPGYQTEFDILKKTREFYEAVKGRLRDTYLHMFELAHHHFRERYEVNHNLYIVAVDRQMAYLDKIIGDQTTNFRHKLKRGDQAKLHERQAG
ncbi:MAG: HD domain-containing protein [Spirochaetaceae bacterium]|nr:MAG: HD domain-containing protein [Spirochaetaceae bacterium]